MPEILGNRRIRAQYYTPTVVGNLRAPIIACSLLLGCHAGPTTPVNEGPEQPDLIIAMAMCPPCGNLDAILNNGLSDALELMGGESSGYCEAASDAAGAWNSALTSGAVGMYTGTYAGAYNGGHEPEYDQNTGTYHYWLSEEHAYTDLPYDEGITELVKTVLEEYYHHDWQCGNECHYSGPGGEGPGIKSTVDSCIGGGLNE